MEELVKKSQQNLMHLQQMQNCRLKKTTKQQVHVPAKALLIWKNYWKNSEKYQLKLQKSNDLFFFLFLKALPLEWRRAFFVKVRRQRKALIKITQQKLMNVSFQQLETKERHAGRTRSIVCILWLKLWNEWE